MSNKKNNIEEIKENIKNLIRQKSMLAFKYAFDSDIIKYSEAIKNGVYRPFSLSSKEIRKVDRMTTVDSKRVWLSGIAIREMFDSGEIFISNSYQSASSHSYAKSYPLNPEYLKMALSKFGLYIKLIKKEDEIELDYEWNEEDGFLDLDDQIDIEGHWLSDIFYNEKEMKRVKSDFKKEESYFKYARNNNREVGNKYTFDD